MTVRMPKFIKEPLTQRQIDKWRRDCLSDRIRHASRAVGGVKYLYWTWENTEKTQKEFWEFIATNIYIYIFIGEIFNHIVNHDY